MLVVLLAACRPAPPTSPALHSVDELNQLWPVRVVIDEAIPQDVLAGLGRWLGSGPGAWAPPRDGSGLPSGLAQRAHTEDTMALRLLARIGLEATCTLGTVPDGFGDLRGGWALAARSCEGVARPSDAAAARRLGEVAADSVATPLPDSLPEMLQPMVELRVVVRGEPLAFRFLNPALLDGLAVSAAEPQPSVPVALAVRTTRWDPRAAAAPVPGAGSTELASIEAAVEEALSGWRASLDALPAESFEPSLRGVANGWVRRTIYEALGAERLESRPDLALVLLEEAVGGAARPRPGPGLDPVLLSRVAFARWRAGEHNRAVELLRDIATQPGWEVAQVAAEMVARVAVIPSAADPRVRR